MDLGDLILELERVICMEFGWPLTGHSLVNTQWNITKLGELTNCYVIFLVMGFISSYDTIWTMCKLGPWVPLLTEEQAINQKQESLNSVLKLP